MAVLTGPPVHALNMPDATIFNALLVGRECWLLGWSVYVAGAATFRAQLFNGGDANGQLVAYATVPTLTGGTQWFGPQGIYCGSGLYWNTPAAVTHIGVVYAAY